MKRVISTIIDPVLQAELDDASSEAAPIAAVIKLRPDRPGKATLSPSETETVTEKVLERVRKNTGVRESEYFVLDMLGAFNVVAPVRFVVDLLKQSEVASAMAAGNESSAYIPPRNVKEVHFPFLSRRSRNRYGPKTSKRSR